MVGEVLVLRLGVFGGDQIPVAAPAKVKVVAGDALVTHAGDGALSAAIAGDAAVGDHGAERLVWGRGEL